MNVKINTTSESLNFTLLFFWFFHEEGVTTLKSSFFEFYYSGAWTKRFFFPSVNEPTAAPGTGSDEMCEC